MHDHLKRVIITGATQGIGLGIAKVFYHEGYEVIGISRRRSKEFDSLGQRAIWFSCDVSDFNKVQKLKAQLSRRGSIQVLINAAGRSDWKGVLELSPTFVEEMLAVNLKSVLWMTKLIVPLMAKKGAIINIASLAGKRGSALNSVYCAAKFGVVGVTQALAKELGPRGIRVNGVCPVYVMTPGVISALAKNNTPRGKQSVKTYLSKFTQEQTALKVLPQVEDVGQICLFLASDAAKAITGQNINIDAGVLPQ